MSEERKLSGGVITSEDQHTHGVMELLTAPVRHRIVLAYYTHPNEIETDHGHDFIAVFSCKDLESVIKTFDARRLPLPLMVHVDDPFVLNRLRYDLLFPGVDVMLLGQARLSGVPDVTLELDLYDKLMQRLGRK
ncbi:MAG: hypothetical protein JW966_10670 [Anaerolineae bacterium]|nr:hypothetical protein [Anaerolineae bacterium]